MIGFLNSLPSVSGKGTDWDGLGPMPDKTFGQTLYMICVAMLIGGIAGLAIGALLYTARDGGVLRNRFVYRVLNVLINLAHPILLIILVTAIGLPTKNMAGTAIGTEVAMFVISIAVTFAIARLVEQNSMSINLDVIETTHVMGTSPWHIIRTVVVLEALGPLVLGYTFTFVTVADMSAMAGYTGGGGLGNFAITYGYQVFDWNVTLVTTLVIIFIVQLAQIFGDWLSKKIIRK